MAATVVRSLSLRPLRPLTRGCWTKDNRAGIDLVGADRDEPGDKLRPAFIGTIKWRSRKPLDGSDMAELEKAILRVTTRAAACRRPGRAGP